MDTGEWKATGIKTLDLSLEICQNSLTAGVDYSEKADFHSSIREFTTVIELFPSLTNLMKNLNLPHKTECEGARALANIAYTAYMGRAMAYMNIGEKEKGNADMIMAKKAKNILNLRIENYKLNSSTYTPSVEEAVSQPKNQYTPPVEKIVSQPTQSTYSNTEKSSDDDVSSIKALFWTAVIFFGIVIAVSSALGISLGKAFLLTLGVIIALIIWLANR